MKLRLAILLLVSTAALSQGPAPTPPKGVEQPKGHSAESQQPAQKDLRGTEGNPPVVKILPAQPPQPAPEKKPADHQDESSPHWGLVYATWGLVAATLALAAVTWLVWGATRGTFEATLAVQRPRLIPDLVTTMQMPAGLNSTYDNVDHPGRPKIKYRFVNHGGSTAFIEEVRDKLVFHKGVPPPMGDVQPMQVASRVIPAGGHGDEMPAAYERELTPDERERYRNAALDSERFFLLVVVKYLDAFGFLTTESFCMKVIRRTNHFERRGGADLNWRKREKVDKTGFGTRLWRFLLTGRIE